MITLVDPNLDHAHPERNGAGEFRPENRRANQTLGRLERKIGERISHSAALSRLMGAMAQRAPLPPFQLLLDKHGSELLQFLESMVGADEAEDCFQEACLAALRAYPELREASNLRGWLFTIARNKALDSARARVRSPIASGSRADGRVSGDPAPAAADREIWAAVDSLPPRQRSAVTLRFAGDLTHREIAAAMDCSEEAARRSLHEGLKRLRREGDEA